MPLISFEDAIADSAQFTKRHLVLGNGFSIACKPDIFHYGSLYAQADFSKVPSAKQVFETLGTQDFEAVIEALETSAKLLPLYEAAGATRHTMQAHASALKEVLVETIAANHPATPGDIPEEKFWACRRFLANFVSGTGGQIFSLNYDLLLYWTLMHEDMPFGEPIILQKNDGFGNDEDDPDADYVVWQGETRAHDACVHFLHGALHLFDSGSELKKYTWIRKGIPLIEQIRSALHAGAFPLFVAEGTSIQKKNKIRHNAYLYQGLKQLTANAVQGKHCFFVFGHSMAANDDHILMRLARGRFPKLYVGIYGDETSPANRSIIARAQGLTAVRNLRNPLSAVFYDAATAHVWG